MADHWVHQTTMMTSDPVLDPRELWSVSRISASDSLALTSSCCYPTLKTFCTEENIPQCITYINQELDSLGVSGLCEDPVGRALNPAPVLNLLYHLLQLHRKQQRSLQDLESQHLKNHSDLEHLQHNNTRLKDQLEHSRRENSGLHEGERQLHLKIRTLQNCLKSEKEEVQKLQCIISSRATQYNHDAKRKERENAKLKERLNQLLVEKRDKKLAIDVVSCVSRSDGKRGMWKTVKMEARHESEMYQTLLSDYEVRLQSLMEENSELKKLLHLIKRDMMSILSPNTACTHTEEQESSVVLEDCGNSSSEGLDQVCNEAREQLSNSIRLQWRKLKERMHSLHTHVSQEEVISRSDHEEAMQLIKVELQQCAQLIHTQQLLLQQLVSSPCDEDTAALLTDGFTLEEKERLKEEWRIFTEQKKNFERERRNFTEAAIRLGHERKTFEEDRGVWLKNQFLNMTPFVERKPTSSHSQSYDQNKKYGTEPEVADVSSPNSPVSSASPSEFCTPKSAAGFLLPTTSDLYRTLKLRPNARTHSSSSSTDTSSNMSASYKH